MKTILIASSVLTETKETENLISTLGNRGDMVFQDR
jgi:hypothetical protein